MAGVDETNPLDASLLSAFPTNERSSRAAIQALFDGLTGTGDMIGSNNLSDVDTAATAFTNIKQAATTAATGVAELATSAEAVTGTDTTRTITPAALKAAFLSPPFIGNTVRGSGAFVAIDTASTAQSTRSISALASHASFNSDVFYGNTTRAASVDFNLIRLDAAGSVKFFVSGRGDVAADIGFSTPATDFAEWIEWGDGNPDKEDRTGISVTFVNGKIAEGQPGDAVFGIISADPAFAGGGDIESMDEDLKGCVGCLGQIPLFKGQQTDSRWIKIKDMLDGRELWWVR